RRLVDERGGKLHALLVAEAQLLYLVVATRRDAEALGPSVDRPACRVDRHPVQPRKIDALVGDLHSRVQTALLGHVPDASPRVEVDRASGPAHLACVRGEHAERDSHRGRLAGAVAADEPEDLAGRYRKRHVLYGDDVAVPLSDLVEL